jgi:predicted permease
MDRLINDVRYTLRRLAATPGFTAIAIISLALGIGANTAIFSIVNGVFFRDSGVGAPEQVVDVYHSSRNGPYSMVEYGDFEAIMEGAADVVESATTYIFFTARLEGASGGEPIMAEIVGGDYLGTFGLTPALGRGFRPEEVTQTAGQAVVMVSDRYWRTRMGGSPGAIGQQLRINGRPYTVIGVMPATFRGKTPGFEPQLWTPMGMRDHLNPGLGDSNNLLLSVRVREGVPMTRAVAAIGAIAEERNRERAGAGSNYRVDYGIVPLVDITFWPGLDSLILAMAALLVVVVGLVLLVACTNLASFLLARGAERRREVAIRLALGASRSALVRQLLTESIVLGLIGGTAGIVVSMLLVSALLGIRPPLGFTISLDAGLDLRVLAFTAVVSVLSGILFGLAPAIRASRSDLVQTLRDEAVGVIGGGGKYILRNALVVTQVAISLVLLIGAGLFSRSLQRATSIDVGFSTTSGAVLTIEGGTSGYSDEQLPALYREVLRRSESASGVTGVAVASKLPLAFGVQRAGLDVPGVPAPPEQDRHLIDYAAVSPSYFEVMGVKLLRGRPFTVDDVGDAPAVAIVSAGAAQRFWPGEDAVGKVVYRAGNRPVTIVGVADNVALTRLTDQNIAYMYVPFLQDLASHFYIVARGNAPAPQLVSSVRQAMRDLDENLFVSEATTMDGHMSLILFLPRMAAWLLSSLGALALLLAVIGLYGVVSYGVSKRTREVGIRMSLGATRKDVVGLLMRGGLTLVAAGSLIGLAIAFSTTRLVRGFLVDVGAADPLTFLLVTALLAGVGALAAYLPARRASAVTPMEALRTE